MRDETPWWRPADPAGWFFRACVMLAFLNIGWAKFGAAPNEWIGLFDRIGLGQWFRYATGVVEMLGGALFLFPRTCLLGSFLIGSAMIGAVIAHLTRLHDPFASVIPLALLAGVLVVAFRVPDAPMDFTSRKASRPDSGRTPPGTL
jgi:putative oxidoreductase